jgi:DNA-binding response OmpR family regulator
MILVVEDEAILAKILQDKLTFLGFNTPVVARSGEQAVQAASEQRPDLVLMDIQLNGQLDGIETARQIREMYEIPVIFMGAFSDVDTVQRAFLTIKAGYLVKPVQLETLSKVIENALNR